MPLIFIDYLQCMCFKTHFLSKIFEYQSYPLAFCVESDCCDIHKLTFVKFIQRLNHGFSYLMEREKTKQIEIVEKTKQMEIDRQNLQVLLGQNSLNQRHVVWNKDGRPALRTLSSEFEDPPEVFFSSKHQSHYNFYVIISADFLGGKCFEMLFVNTLLII